MKPYQHHDEYHDIGKAVPSPKAPNNNSARLVGQPLDPEKYVTLTGFNKHGEQYQLVRKLSNLKKDQ
jgi:hypothetical protein